MSSNFQDERVSHSNLRITSNTRRPFGRDRKSSAAENFSERSFATFCTVLNQKLFGLRASLGALQHFLKDLLSVTVLDFVSELVCLCSLTQSPHQYRLVLLARVRALLCTDSNTFGTPAFVVTLAGLDHVQSLKNFRQSPLCELNNTVRTRRNDRTSRAERTSHDVQLPQCSSGIFTS